MARPTLTGVKDTDRQILYKLHGAELVHACLVDSYTASLCDRAFWLKKVTLDRWISPQGQLTDPFKVYKAMNQLNNNLERLRWAIRHREPHLVRALIGMMGREYENVRKEIIGAIMDVDDVSLYDVVSSQYTTDELQNNLSVAISHGAYEISEIILKRLSSVPFLNAANLRVIINAVIDEEDIDVLSLLLEYRPNELLSDLINRLRVSLQNKQRVTLHFIKWLLREEVIDPHKVDGYTLLSVAIRADRMDMVKYCLNTIEWTLKEKSDALNNAVLTDNINMVTFLIDFGVDIHYNNEEALYLAGVRRNAFIVKLLLSHKAKFWSIDSSLPQYGAAFSFITSYDDTMIEKRNRMSEGYGR